MPTASAAAHRRGDGRSPEASTQATAYATVKSGANTARTTIRPASVASVASWSASATGSPSASETQKRRP
jgi:hypothetical protein